MARNDRKFHWLSFDAKKSTIGPKTQKLGPIFEKSCFFKIAKKWLFKKGRIEKNAFECQKVRKSCFFKIAKKWLFKKGRIEENAFECQKV